MYLNLKRFKYFKYAIIYIVCISFVISLLQFRVYATDKYLDSKEKYGSSYWSSSNLREWINSNSNAGKVKYSCKKPEYKGEAGFLNNFTTNEQNAIAITNHRISLNKAYESYADGGNKYMSSNSTSSVLLTSNYEFLSDYNNLVYKNEKDKVYLLNPYEIYWYLNRRGYEMVKLPTIEATQKTGIDWDISWWTNGGYAWYLYDKSIVYNGTPFGSGFPNARYGVVPAINIKPTYKFSNGVYAKDLKIGNRVTFGTYLGSSIEWQVINISDNGYPLLLSNSILDVKQYDSPGDDSKEKSEYINYDDADVSYADSIQYHSITMSSDTEPPKLEILNTEELGKRQDGKFVMKFRINDESKLLYSILPDGTRTSEKEFSYTFESNGQYSIKSMDEHGNYNEFLIPVSNINALPYIDIIPSTIEWTNNDVTVNIKAFNDIAYHLDYLNLPWDNWVDWDWNFPNYINYVNNQFEISGTVKLICDDENILNEIKKEHITIGAMYISREKKDFTYVLKEKWKELKKIPIQDILKTDNHEINFNYMWTVPEDYTKKILPVAWYMNNIFNDINEDNCKIEITNFNYTLKDNSGFRINSIIAPNGVVIKDKSYTDVISTEGEKNYNYSVLDNRGIITNKTIHLKIDKSAPDIYAKCSILGNTTNIEITATDNLSGIKQIKLPNGNYVKDSKVSFLATENKSYEFQVEDNAGNISVKTIDNYYPDLELNKSISSWTNKPITISFKASSTVSGIKYIILPDNNIVNTENGLYLVNSNGVYTFKAVNNDNRETIKQIIVDNIDMNPPTVNIYNINDWTNTNSVDVSMTSFDN